MNAQHADLHVRGDAQCPGGCRCLGRCHALAVVVEHLDALNVGLRAVCRQRLSVCRDIHALCAVSAVVRQQPCCEVGIYTHIWNTKEPSKFDEKESVIPSFLFYYISNQ